MPRIGYSQSRSSRRIGGNLIDAFALAAALLWLGVMIGLAWGSNIPLLPALQRGIVGSIFVYSAVFIGLHLTFRMAGKTALKSRRAKAKSQPERPTEPAQEQTLDTAREEGGA
jgi:hypothetical protein